jgi:hypothetical protein
MNDIVALKPRPKLLTFQGLLTHGYMDAETAEQIRALMLELIGEDGDVPEGENMSWNEMRYQAAQLGINSERAKLRKKVEEL